MNQVKLLHKVAMALYNAREEVDILQELSKLSYDKKAFLTAEKLYNQFQEMILVQEDAQFTAKEATKAVQQVRLRMQQQYLRHVSLSRLIFKGNDLVIAELGLKGKRHQRLDKWLEQCQRYYKNAAKHMHELQKYNIQSTEITEMKILLNEVMKLNAMQKVAQSKAQLMTHQKQKMGTALDQWYRRFTKIARIALEENPQHLEALGIGI